MSDLKLIAATFVACFRASHVVVILHQRRPRWGARYSHSQQRVVQRFRSKVPVERARSKARKVAYEAGWG